MPIMSRLLRGVGGQYVNLPSICCGLWSSGYRPLTEIFPTQVLLTVETDTDEASEGEEEPGDTGPVPNVHYSGGPLRPSWVVV